VRTIFQSAALATALLAAPAYAQVFEVIHPDVQEGGIEFEVLNTLVVDAVAVGEERSVHEFAIGYAPFSFWKTTLALEAVTARGNGNALEAFEWENVFLFFGGHDHDHDHGDDNHGGGFGLSAFGFYAAVEVPQEGGIEAGEIALGPIAEFELGPVETIANLFIELPLADGSDPGLAYALSAAVPVFDFGTGALAAGFEAHGGVEGLFGDNTTPLGQNSHVVGPALYSEFEVGKGQFIEPRLAVLFGVSNGAPDAAVSFNIELKY